MLPNRSGNQIKLCRSKIAKMQNHNIKSHYLDLFFFSTKQKQLDRHNGAAVSSICKYFPLKNKLSYIISIKSRLFRYTKTMKRFNGTFGKSSVRGTDGLSKKETTTISVTFDSSWHQLALTFRLQISVK